LEVARASGPFGRFAFIDDDTKRHGQEFAGSLVLGGSRQLPEFAAAGFTHLMVCIGSNRMRARSFEFGLKMGLQAATLIHPSAVISASAQIGAGTVVMPRVVVNAGARIGKNCILNTGAIVEHDCQVGNHVHLGQGCILGGASRVDAYSFIGTAGVVLPEAHVEQGATIGAGAVVLRHIGAGVTAVGVPARPLRPVG
jgi:sugar O-acyltransferase (sialic acid O-acetyltransferase NeuD family)